MQALLIAGAILLAAEVPTPDAPRLPETLQDVSGAVVDVAGLARERNLVLVTVKFPGCPVCHEQLLRLKGRLADLEACGVTFIVLAPGPAEALAEVRRQTGFPFPFVEDRDLALARSLGLVMAPGQILPCMLEIRQDRTVGWSQMGRNGAYFGDAELGAYFDCARAV